MSLELLDELSDEQLEKFLAERKRKKQADLEAKRKTYETLKDETINKLGFMAVSHSDQLLDFKEMAMNEMESIYEVIQEYSNRKEGKGNFQIENDNYKIIYRNRTIMDFDERAGQAKKHIMDFVNAQWQGTDNDEKTRNIILSLLNGRDGQIDVRDVQKLYQYENDFDNENWRMGLQLLKESYNEKDTKAYIQFQKKQADGSFETILMNFSKL